MLIVHRTALRRRISIRQTQKVFAHSRLYHSSKQLRQEDPRLKHVLEDDFLVLREKYDAPKHPIILAHGLLGFDEFHVPGRSRGIQYWYGIREALAARGVEVITAAVPPSGRIEARAEKLAEAIEKQARGKAVNIIAYDSPSL